MQVRVFGACPACSCGQSSGAYRPNRVALDRFIELSRIKYQGLMDEWVYHLGLEIRECNRCRHLWYRSQPDEESLGKMYDASRPLFPEPSEWKLPRPILRDLRALCRLMRWSGVSRPGLLDYGSGKGSSVRAAAQAGFRVCAYEPSRERAKKLTDVSGVRVVYHLEEIAGETFDVVNLEQVLEHTQCPLEILTSLRAYCRPQTILRVAVPNIARYRGNGDMWSGFPFNGKIHIMSPYEHLQGFNPVSLRVVLARAGLTTDCGVVLWVTNPVFLIRSLAGYLFSPLQQTLAFVRFIEDHGRVSRSMSRTVVESRAMG